MAKYAIYICGMPEPEELRVDKNPECPNSAEHTLAPGGYLQWHDWAETMQKTHRTVKCSGCGLFRIWVPKKQKETADG